MPELKCVFVIACFLTSSHGNESCSNLDLKALMVRLRVLSTEFHDFVIETKRMMQEKENQIDDLQRQLNNSNQQISALKRDILDMPNKDNNISTQAVAFKARTVKNKSPTPGEHMIYTQTILNKGDGYDNESGYFTAPTNGMYLFNVQVCVWIKKWIRAHIIAADQVIGQVSYYDFDKNASCTSGSGVAVLTTGDKVWVNCTNLNSYSDPNILFDNTTIRNNFSGVLIHVTQ